MMQDISVSELARQGWKNYERKFWKEMHDKFNRDCHEKAVDIYFPKLSETEKKEMVDKLMEEGISCLAWIVSTKKKGGE